MRHLLIATALGSCVFAARIHMPAFNHDRRELIGTAEDEADLDFPGSKFHNFVSRPDIKAPRFTVKVFDQDALAPGYWFVAPYHDLTDASNAKHWVGPYIYDGDGEPVWAGGSLFQHFNVFDFKVARFHGEDMLNLKFPHDSTGVIFDNTYRVRKEVVFNKDLKYGRDMHEFTLVNDGALALVIVSTEHQSTIAQGKEVGLQGNQTCRSLWKGFQELDTETSDAVFTWDARDHLSLKETTYKPGDGRYSDLCTGNFWDILHLNAVDKFDDGDYLVSARHTDTLYKISHIDGSVVWRLGGTMSDFKFATANVKFSRQHHATVRGQNETHYFVAMFDNAVGTGSANEKPTHKNSRGLLLALNRETKVASVEAAYDHPKGGLTNSRGSFQTLPNGNAFMGWTYHTLLSEHAPDGRLLMQAELKLAGHCYRNFKFNWVGRPAAPPDIYASASKANGTGAARTIVYASWNGATEVASWNLLRSDETGQITDLVASSPRTGFETTLVFNGFARYAIAEAVDRHGKSLGRSNAFKTEFPEEDDFQDAQVADAQWLQSAAHTSLAHTATHVASAVAESPLAAFLSGIIFTVFVGLTVFGILRCRRNASRRTQEQYNEQGDSEPLLHQAASERGDDKVDHGPYSSETNEKREDRYEDIELEKHSEDS